MLTRLAVEWRSRITWPACLSLDLDAERQRLVLWLPVFMGIGVLTYYALRTEPSAWFGAGLLGLTGAMVAVSSLWPAWRPTCLPAIAACLGFMAAEIATARAPPLLTNLPTHATIVSGTVRAVEVVPGGRRVTLEAVHLDDQGETLARLVRVRLRASDAANVAAGDALSVRALIRQPSGPSYPGAWDQQRDAYYSGLGASGFALGAVRVTSRDAAFGPTRFVQWLRETIAQRVLAVVPGGDGAICVTLLTGQSIGIPLADHAAFRDSGLAHLLAVAGLHIGIVMGLVFGSARVAFALSEHASLFWPTKKLSALIALAAGAGYMVLTGMHVPIVRSFVMACLVTLALLLGRRAVSLRGLALAAVALMVLEPQQVPGVSFQMSFSAVLALISGYEALRPWLNRLHGQSLSRRLRARLVALALTSFLAGTASMPFGAYHFGRIQLYYIVANMAAVPLTAFWILPAGMIALVLMPTGLDWLALVPMGWGARAVLWVARTTAAWPDATVTVPHMPIWGLCVLSAGLAWLGISRSPLRLAGLAAILLGIASPIWDRPPDLLISDDARLIAVRTASGIWLQQKQGGSAFIRDEWLQYWGARSAMALPREGSVAHGMLSCEADVCLLRPRSDGRAAMLVRGAIHPAGCDVSDVIVSAEPARGLCPWPWPQLVDRFTVWRYGATAVWLDGDGARILTDRMDRGRRPWVPQPPTPRVRPASKLPPADIDRTE